MTSEARVHPNPIYQLALDIDSARRLLGAVMFEGAVAAYLNAPVEELGGDTRAQRIAMGGSQREAIFMQIDRITEAK